MAVTRQTYTATATWTAAQLATLFENAFIDAGLMTAWHDSFLSGTVLNRVLEITYDGTKTYGKTYYWFTFTTTLIGVSIATGWNTTTKVPTGTAFLDFFATTTNTQVNHYTIATSLATGTSAEVTRYTDSGYTWFVFRNGPSPIPFFIAPAATVIAPWIDLNKVVFHHFILGEVFVTAATGISQGTIQFTSLYALRRSYYAQGFLRGRVTLSSFLQNHILLAYRATGNTNNTSANYTSTVSVLVPYGFNNTNPAYTADYFPVINGYSYSNYVTSSMPADFGLLFNYTAATFAFGDRIIVSAGVEEWEVYGFANNNTIDNASSLLVARVV